MNATDQTQSAFGQGSPGMCKAKNITFGRTSSAGLDARAHPPHSARRRMASAALVGLFCLGFTISAKAGVFNVRAYGAVGDGVTDDGQAIQTAVNAAIRAGAGNEVYLPSGNYYLGPNYSTANAQIVIKNAAGLSLLGDPSTTLTSAAPTKDFFYLGSSSNITFDNLTLKRDHLMFTQVRVKSVDTVRNSVDVVIEPGYDDIGSAYLQSLGFLLVFSNPSSGTWGDHGSACAWYNPKDQSVCWPPTITSQTRVAPGEWILGLNTSPQPNYIGMEAVAWNANNKGKAFNIINTNGLVVQNVTYLPGGTEGGFVIALGSGNYTFSNFSVDVAPGSGQLISAIGGAMVFNNHINLTLNQVRIAHVWDDAINMGANFARVFSQEGPFILDVDGSRGDFRVGDVVALWDWTYQKQHERSRATITGISCGKTSPLTCRVQLDQSVAMGKMGYAPVVSKGNDTDGIDRLIDMNSAGSMNVTGSSFQSLHAHGLLLRASNSQVLNSEIHDTVMAGIQIGPDFYWDEGPAVSNVLIQNNLFYNVSGSNVLVQNGSSSNNQPSSISLDTSNITIKDNYFVDYGQYQHGVLGNTNAPIFIRNVTRATISGNSLLAFAPGPSNLAGGTDFALSTAVAASNNAAVSKATLAAELQVSLP